MAQSTNGPILVSPPKKTDGKLPYYKCATSSMLKKRFLFEYLGKSLYEYRHNQKADTMVLLESLPIGYSVASTKGYYIRGHPSKRSFSSASSFALHLLWLDSFSKFENPPNCECCLCTQVRNKHPIFGNDISTTHNTTPAETTSSRLDVSASSSTGNVDSVTNPEGSFDTTETILLFPMTKVLIELPKVFFHRPPTCTIPLPTMKVADKSILLNSLLKP